MSAYRHWARSGAAAADSVRVLGKVVTANAAPLGHDRHRIDSSVSVGVASFPQHAGDGETLRKLADQAMYAAKARGGNCCVFHGR